MNIILVSQCSKKALTETRRILDQFAERCGDRTWQTSITNQGLETLYRLLRKTARKNTAVACRWVRSRNHTELLWIVGDRSKFNAGGAVPTNTTKRNILRSESENNWHTAKVTELITRIAALFHDFGKSCDDFQMKLKLPLGTKLGKNLIRHEWISIRMFTAFVGDSDCRTWLQKLADGEISNDWREALIKDGIDKDTAGLFKSASPLVKAICWLIVSHHRMPVKEELNIKWYDRLPDIINGEWCRSAAENAAGTENYWNFPVTPFDSETWLRAASKTANEFLKLPGIDQYDYLNPYMLTVSRKVLMFSDHVYSSFKHKNDRMKGDHDFPLYANTDRTTGELKQPLDEHLTGLEKHVRRVMHFLPDIRNLLPSITDHKIFKRRNSLERYKWQDKAYDLACSVREKTFEAGFFGINMASTGCGKTIANGRIIYGLASPEKGARFTIALGLRTLTLQTGDTYRSMLSLGPDSLAVLVGGGPVKDLYRLQQEEVFRSSESEDEFLPEDSYVHYEGSFEDTPFARWFKNEPKVSGLLNAPVVTCTIDHIIPASEGIAGGQQLAPLLRLMTGDLVLDEPDDFDVNDLYALSRLVYYAGLCGSRVLLSSATITPSIAEGLFRAYEAGRVEHNRNRCSQPQNGVCCAWFDENGCFADLSVTSADFAEKHKKQILSRINFLEKQPPRVTAEILPVDNGTLTEHILTGVKRLHDSNCLKDGLTGTNVSFGIVRIANINSLVALVREFAGADKPDDYIFHICCYHSKFPLALRSKMERTLDRLLDRRGESILSDALVRRCIQKHIGVENHVFIVFASPVAEVGRDHDYDWALAEPSSMRSIIQLAGRIRRHRPGKYKETNMLIMDKNIKAQKGKDVCYAMPGFESKDFKLKVKNMKELLRPEEYGSINSIPRILENENFNPEEKLADMEHFRLRSVMMKGEGRKVASTDLFWETPVWLSGCMQMNKRFRKSPAEQEYVLKYDVDEGTERFHLFDKGEVSNAVNSNFKKADISINQAEFFINMDYEAVIEELAERLDISFEKCSEKFGRFSLIENENNERPFFYNSYLGLFREQSG